MPRPVVAAHLRRVRRGAPRFAAWRARLAADFRVTAEAPTVLYDAPSAKARPLFVYGRDVPVEVLVNVEGWTKVRDAAAPSAGSRARV